MEEIKKIDENNLGLINDEADYFKKREFNQFILDFRRKEIPIKI